MEKEKILQIAVPAVAIAVIVFVVVFIVSGTSTPTDAPKVVTGTLPPLPQGKKMIAEVVPPTSEGVGLELPDLNAPEWKPLGDGLKIWDVKVGEGDIAVVESDDADWHYTGWLPSGRVFDSSVRKGQAFSTNLRNVVQGWTRGLPGMKVGGVRRLFIPSPLGYGSKGAGSDIPANTDLIFEVKLLRISR